MIKQLQSQKNWQMQLAKVVGNLEQLLVYLELDIDELDCYAPKDFPLKVPMSFVEKMEKGNINDPLLKQVLPSTQALKKVTGYVQDPLEENEFNPHKGLIHKYQSRVLITITGACAIHCRYCFRQHFDYKTNTPKKSEKEKILEYIVENPEVNEVLMSGGDPLNVSNKRLFSWIDDLANLSQITTVRIHTRLPIVIPERLDDELLEFFTRLNHSKDKAKLVMVIHCNHANEIDDNTAQFLLKLKQTGTTVLNQSVLLKNINDNVETQVALSHRLFDAGVLPYYLHVLDKVDGASYFDISDQEAVKLYWQMLAKLSGYLMPKLVRELPDKPFKTPVNLYDI